MTQEQEFNNFIASLRRLMYLNQIFKFELEDMLRQKVKVPQLNNDCRNLQNTCKEMVKKIDNCFRQIKLLGSNPKDWESIQSELSSDDLFEIMSIIEIISQIKNVDEIRAALEETVKNHVPEIINHQIA